MSTDLPLTQLFTWLGIKGFTDRSLEESHEVKLIFETCHIFVLNMQLIQLRICNLIGIPAFQNEMSLCPSEFLFKEGIAGDL